MRNDIENICNDCKKVHEKRNIDLLPTWLQCKKCGRLYCVDCAKSSIRRISIEKLLMTIIVILLLYIGVFILEDLTEPFTSATLWGVLMTILPVGFQMLLLKYHESTLFKEKQVLKKCRECGTPLNTMYHDSILNSWLFTIYAFNILVYLFEFFFKLYNLYDKAVPQVIGLSNFGVILWIIFLIVIIIASLITALRLYRYILSSFQSSYRIWILIILIYILNLYFVAFWIEFNYIIYSGLSPNVEILYVLNIIYTMFFAAIPKIFWFVPAFLISAILYTIERKYLLNYKTNNWLKLAGGFILIVVPLILWGIFYPYFNVAWESIISWTIANVIFNLLTTLGIFTIIERMKKTENKSHKIKDVIWGIVSIIILTLYLLLPIINKMMTGIYGVIFTCITSFFVFIILLFELFKSWFNENSIWRSKIFKNIPDATYLVLVGILCYCIAMNASYFLYLSPLHSFFIVEVPGVFVFTSSTAFFVGLIGSLGIIIAPILKLIIRIYFMYKYKVK
ncbi:MAG: hypothetical protein ACTSRP_14255 [Candidatus Helarchaeota archaeon]